MRDPASDPRLTDGRRWSPLCRLRIGRVVVFAAGEFRLISSTKFPSDAAGWASIALTHGQVLVRTANTLHVFARP